MRKIDALTGLRLFAAVSILLWHSDEFLPRSLFAPFFLAGAVPLFFVLSGFVLTVNVDKYSSWKDFFAARVARIWPAHLASLAFLFAIFYPYSIWDITHRADLQWQLPVNIALLQAWFPDRLTYYSFNGVAWSVSVELFFYAVFPLCVWALARRAVSRSALLLAAVFVFVNGAGYFVSDAMASWVAQVLPVACLPSFVVGIAAATVWRNMPESSAGVWAATAMQVLAIAAALGANAELYGLAVPGVSRAGLSFLSLFGAAPFYALMLIALAHYDGMVSRALSNSWIVYGGEISYSIYLFHQPILRWHADRASEFQTVPLWAQYVVVVAAVLAISAMSYRFVEGPCRKSLLAVWRRIGGAESSGIAVTRS